jgi:LacI family transcriptional regulator
LSDTQPRWRGVRSLARERGLKLDPKLIVDLPESRDPFSSFEDGYKLTEELLHRRHPFTALMAFDDMSAFGAIRALAKAGINVPGQCSVIGFDDVAPAAFYHPALTTIRQPMEVMGASAATLVVEAINAALEKKPARAIHRKVSPELIVRESTQSLK